MEEKKCLKCGHVTSYSGKEPEICTNCGAFYRKVEATLQNPTQARSTGHKTRNTTANTHEYIALLRSETVYPTWRTLVNIMTWLWYLMAILLLIGAFIGFSQSFAAGIGGIVGAIFFAIFGRVSKELAFMLSDLSDATIRIAQRAESD